MYRHSGTLSNTKSELGVNTMSRRTEVGSRLRRKGKKDIVESVARPTLNNLPCIEVMSKGGLKSVYCYICNTYALCIVDTRFNTINKFFAKNTELPHPSQSVSIMIKG